MQERVVLGLTESILVGKLEVIARIDTGATSSSIDKALVDKLNLGPVITSKIIKSASGIKERPVIKATIKLKNIEIEDEFTVADRSHMTYPVLIGQPILKKGQFLIDPLKEVKK